MKHSLFKKICINIKSSIQDPHREIRMFCIIKWSWILFVKAETRWFGSMGWVSSYFQIYHILKILRCKRVKSTSYVVTYVSWLPKNVPGRFLADRSIFPCRGWSNPMPEQVEHEDATHCLNKWRMRVSEDVVRLQDRMIKMNVSYFLCICIVSGLESRGLSKLFIIEAKGLLN